MGDYTKFIANFSIDKIPESEFDSIRNQFDSIYGLCSSAYHCGGELFHIDNDWHHRTAVTIVTQLKYGSHLDELVVWIRSIAIEGMGENDCIALAFWEYKPEPDVFYLKEENKI